MKQPHRARRLALQGICCLDARRQKTSEPVDHFIQDSKESPETIDAARKLLAGVCEDLPRIDEILARHARHWELSRLALVDRNILRLATWELRSGKTPHKVAIAEALRLAQEFSTIESPRFINGVLDAVARELDEKAAGGN